MGFFESFSAPFMMSVALWPLVSFIVTVPVLAMLYHRDNRLGFGAALSAYATVLYLIGLLCFTLYPMPDDPAAYCATHHLHPQLNPLQFIGDIRADGLTAILQIVMNVVFFHHYIFAYSLDHIFICKVRHGDVILPFPYLVVLGYCLDGVLASSPAPPGYPDHGIPRDRCP